MNTQPAPSADGGQGALARQRAQELMDITVDAHQRYFNSLFEMRRAGESSPDFYRERIKLFMWFSQSFPRWMANVHAKCPELAVRQRLVRNMYDEEVFDQDLGDYHVGKQIKEAEILGLKQEELCNPADITPTMFACLNTWDHLTRTRSWQAGLAALACLELTNVREFRERLDIPSAAEMARKIDIPGIGESAMHHEVKDEDHGASELEDICVWIESAAVWDEVKRTVRESSEVFALFLEGLHRRIVRKDIW